MTIYSISDGTVLVNSDGSSGNGGAYGWHIIVLHDDPVIGKFCALYAHLKNKSTLKEGDVVEQGGVIGKQGNTAGPGYEHIKYGSHLHFQTWRGSKITYKPNDSFNPLEILYRLEMTKDSIGNSGIFALDVSQYSGERSFLKSFPNGTIVQRSSAIHYCNDEKILAYMRELTSK